MTSNDLGELLQRLTKAVDGGLIALERAEGLRAALAESVTKARIYDDRERRYLTDVKVALRSLDRQVSNHGGAR
jgi:hypothetical protein